jgi:hypothetical protein
MSEQKKPYTLAEDEKVTPVMVYTLTNLAWGDLVTKEPVRVNTYLRTLAPDYVDLYDARSLPIGGAGINQPVAFTELHIRMPQVIAFHLLPPASEPADYDPAESNRKMEPVTVLIGPFRFDAMVRMSTMASLSKFLEITTEVFISIYDAAASCPVMPGMGTIRSPLVLVRRDAALFASR